MSPQKVFNRHSLNMSTDSDCLDLSIRGFYAVLYYPYSDPGNEFEIVSEQDLENNWECLKRGTEVTVKFGSARVQGVVVTLGEDYDDLTRNFQNITDAYREELIKQEMPSRRTAPPVAPPSAHSTPGTPFATPLATRNSAFPRHVIKVMDRETQTEANYCEADYVLLKSKYEELKVEYDKFSAGMSSVQANLEQAMKALRNLSTTDDTSSVTSSASSENDVLKVVQEEQQENEDPFNTMIQIGPNGTKVKKVVYDSLNWHSYRTVTRKLLMTLFPRKVLATHSLTGKPSPAFMGTREKKDRLDPAIIEDIIEVVSKKCKIPESLVRNAITTKCADENKLYRKRVQGVSGGPNSSGDKNNTNQRIR